MGQLSLKKNIYIGFAVIVGLLIANGLVSYFGLLRVRGDSARKQQIDQISSTVLRMDRDVQELQLRVDRYVATGQPALREEAEEIHRRLRESIAAAQEGQLDPEVDELFGLIGSHIRAYEEQFKMVVVERRIRVDLVQAQLPALSKAVRAAFESLSVALEANEPTDEDRLILTRSQSLFSQAEKSFLRYFATPSTQHVNAAADAIASAVLSVQQLSERGETRAVVDALAEYEKTGLRAVQATRSYLFFQNVVLAGEASEVGYYANSLRDLTAKKSQEIATESLATSNRINLLTATTIGVAAVLATLMAARLAYLVIPPLTALTAAFTELSHGKTLEEIPGATRGDEIGAMAQAARVFSDRNQQTRELLEQSEELGEELTKQAEELDNFAYIASHDLKSPLRGIRQLASWIEEDAADSLTGDSIDHLQHMQARVGKMESLLEGLLDYSRVGRLKPKPEPVDVNELLAGIAEITNNPSGVALRLPDKLPTFTTLRAPLEQVLRNLVENAIKYNPHGEEGFVNLEWEARGNWYHVAVSDNGPGIHPKDHERVFQMYQRVGDPDSEGSGMGLALVKKQIENAGGTVRLESSLGEGSRFEFTWPTEPTQADEEST